MKLIKYSLLPGLALILCFGCTKNFEAYNTNPNNATQQQLQYDNLGTGVFFSQMEQNIFPTAQQPAFGDEMYQIVQNLCGDIYSGYMGASNNWFGGVNSTNYSMTPSWYGQAFGRAFLSVMPAWLSIKKQTQGNPSLQHIYALAQIIKVESISRTTDMYGPLPYKQFGAGGLTTTYDGQDAIYASFFTDLDSAISTLSAYVQNNPGSMPLASYDLIYAGDYTKWIKFANSLKLRLAMRIAYADPANAKKYAEAAVANPYGVMMTDADDALLQSANGVNIHNPLQIICFNFNDIRMGATMESLLGGYKDPRLSKMFNPAVKDGQYHGIRTGITITNVSLYADPFSTLNVALTTPIRWMSAAEMYFLRAEGAVRGWSMGGTAQSLYETGVQTSFTQWGAGSASAYILDSTSKAAVYVDPSNSANNMSSGLSTITVKWKASDAAETQLERIVTQKWIAMYPDGQEAWSEFRRTGYPKVFPVVVNNSGGLIQTAAQIQRLPFPQSEYQSNAAGVATGVGLLGGLDNGGTKLWWDKKP
ncbi:MAG: SusD/RagB family nutrient-binding outer membrane lipoprotein [Bacteroidetes bacterium]|nr:SusD/RagB family nutrient-binding outer membrane lipoprotein [Bacteroidota bacterium]